MPIPETQANLKSFFETGDIPNQTQFASLIDTMFYNDQDAKNVANQAATDAAAAVAALASKGAKVILSAQFVTGTGWVIRYSVGVSGLSGGSATALTVTFTAGTFANANYAVFTGVSWGVSVLTSAANVTIQATPIFTPAAANIVLAFPTAPANGRLYLAIFG